MIVNCHTHNLLAQLIREHGVDKILFGTDYPMTVTTRELQGISRLPLSVEEKNKVLGKNAAALLGL